MYHRYRKNYGRVIGGLDDIGLSELLDRLLERLVQIIFIVICLMNITGRNVLLNCFISA